ncbi:MAG: serine/threonine-protein kinase [Pseudomonadota bacterium]
MEEGTQVGPVVLEEAIDRGGYGIVYRGTHDTLGLVAVKEFFPKMVASRSRSSNQIVHAGSRSDAQAFEKGLQKFLGEAHVLERLNHPNVVKFHDVIEANGTAYLVMHFVVGKTLGDFIVQNSEEIDERFSQRVAVDIAGALDALHAEGIIHQDVAPDNIIIEKTTKRPILIDFGGAKQVVYGYSLQSEAALVKPGFSPPEQFPKSDVKGLEKGPWSDLYGLSAVLYNLVTGRPPQDSITRMETDHMVSAKKAGVDRATPSLLQAIDWGLKVSPQKRPQYVSEWLKVAEGASRPSFTIALPKVQIDPKVFAAMAAMLVLAVVGTGAIRLVSGLTDNWAFNRAMTGDCASARSYISKQKERSADPGLLQISQWCDARDEAFADGSIDAFAGFARDYSPNRIPETARVTLTTQTETALWEAVNDADSLQGYEAYLSVYPDGTHFVQASDGIEALRASVKDLQQRLKNIGLYTSAIDGDPGDGTQRAANNLAQNTGAHSVELMSASNAKIGSLILLADEEEQRLAELRARAERERLAQEQLLAEERAAAERRRVAEEQERVRQAKLAQERKDYNRVRSLKTSTDYDWFLDRHNNGVHTEEIRYLRAQCKMESIYEWMTDSEVLFLDSNTTIQYSGKNEDIACFRARLETNDAISGVCDSFRISGIRNLTIGFVDEACGCDDHESNWNCEVTREYSCSFERWAKIDREVCP